MLWKKQEELQNRDEQILVFSASNRARGRTIQYLS